MEPHVVLCIVELLSSIANIIKDMSGIEYFSQLLGHSESFIVEVKHRGMFYKIEPYQDEYDYFVLPTRPGTELSYTLIHDKSWLHHSVGP